MFCANCGEKMNPIGNFCNNCGARSTKVIPNVKRTSQNDFLAEQSKKNYKEPILLGDGKIMYKRVFIYFLYMVVAVVACMWALDYIDNAIPQRITRQQRDMINIVQVLLVISVILQVGYSLFRIYQECIVAQMCNIVIGKDAVKGRFVVGSLGVSVQEAHLPYHVILNVDVVKESRIALYTQHTKYVCYAKNCNELRDKIMERIHSQNQKNHYPYRK